MKFSKLFVAVLGVASVSAIASDAPLPRNARRVKRATIEAMIDPPGSFAVMYWGEGVGGQCPINPNWTVTVTLRPDIDGTYIQSVCPRTGPTPCECDIFVRTDDTKQALEAALEPYQQEYKKTLPIDPSPDAKVQSSRITYTTETPEGSVRGPFVMDLAEGKTMDVTLGDEFKFEVDGFVPAGSESPCADPKGRPCRLTLDLYQVLPDGSRKLSLWQVESEWGTAWLSSSGNPETVTLAGIIPHPKSYRAIPSGKAVLVGQWFLLKNYASLVDYQVPVGGFEVPVNIR